MTQIPVSELIPGMVTAEDVLSYDKSVIVPSGIILTENIISRLEGYSIYYVHIDGSIADDLSVPMGNPAIRKYAQGYTACVERYQDYIMDSLYRSLPFHAKDLLGETLALLRQDGANVNVFDMLLGMRSSADSVYAHCIHVALISNMLSQWLGFPEADQIMATACGLFHDVGKFMLPASVLRKPGKLTPSEFEIVKTHTTEGFHMLGRFQDIPEAVKNAALMHHEKCDGSGYPYGLTGGEIDKFSKIVTIADIFDAMTSNRTYHAAMSPFSVIKYFEDDGIQKYEMKYILTFLENVSNSYLNRHVTLSNGMEGNVVFINPDHFPKPAARTEEEEIISLEQQHYRNILQLSNRKNISIETII